MTTQNQSSVTQNQSSEQVLTVTNGVLTAYTQSMTTLLERAKIFSPYTLVKLGVVGSVVDIAKTSLAARSGNPYEGGKAFFGAVGGVVGGAIGGAAGVGWGSVPLAVGGNYFGGKGGELLWEEAMN